jgi:transcriptional regulator with XRE-family HTH domain
VTDPPLREVFGRLLRRVRLRQGRTLADVAERARVSAQYLSEVERGRKEPSSEVLAAVCVALGVDLPDLLVAAGRDLLAARPTVAPVLRLADARAARPPSTGRPGEVRLLVAA